LQNGSTVPKDELWATPQTIAALQAVINMAKDVLRDSN
jgi:hypothetical protein